MIRARAWQEDMRGSGNDGQQWLKLCEDGPIREREDKRGLGWVDSKFSVARRDEASEVDREWKLPLTSRLRKPDDTTAVSSAANQSRWELKRRDPDVFVTNSANPEDYLLTTIRNGVENNWEPGYRTQEGNDDNHQLIEDPSCDEVGDNGDSEATLSSARSLELVAPAGVDRMARLDIRHLVTQHSGQTLTGIMRLRVTPKTLVRYQKQGLPVFRRFLEAMECGGPDAIVSEYLETDGRTAIDGTAATNILARYGMWLGAKGMSVGPHMQALRFAYNAAGKSIQMFDHPLVIATRRQGRGFDGREVARKKLSKVTEAMTAEMMQAGINKYFPEDVVLEIGSSCKWDEAGAILSAMLQYDYAVRTSSAVKSVSRSEAVEQAELVGRLAKSVGEPVPESFTEVLEKHHALRAEDVWMGSGTVEDMKWRTAFEFCTVPFDQSSEREMTVKAISMVFLTDKVNQRGQRPRVWVTLGEGSLGAALMVRMVSTWARAAKYPDGSTLFFSRPGVLGGEARRNVTVRDVRMMAKSVAILAGRNPIYFSAKSFKNGGISAVKAAGATNEEVAAFVGHRSTKSTLHYIRDTTEAMGGASASWGTGVDQYTDKSLTTSLSLRDAKAGTQVGAVEEISGRKQKLPKSAIPIQRMVLRGKGLTIPALGQCDERGQQRAKRTRRGEQAVVVEAQGRPHLH